MVRGAITWGRLAALVLMVPAVAFGQASDPFSTGADSLLDFVLTLAVPVGALVIVGLALAGMTGNLPWGKAIAAMVFIAVMLGAPQIITWIQSMFAV